jgi:hypothetical protein
MSATTNLAITHVEESQSQKEVTINEAFDKLDDLGLGGFTLTIDGAGSEIADNVQSRPVEIPYDIIITKVTAYADQSGSIVIDAWNDTYANYPAANADSITAAAPITISAAIKSQDATLTGWDTTLAAGSHLILSVDSCTTIEWVQVAFQFKRVVS